jgi:heme/copper-type cytochrome/quinol oxidase subunit 3
MGLTPQTTIYLLMLVIYIIIIYIFDHARRKYKGGTIEMVIKLILINTFLLLAADYTYLLGFLGLEIVSILQTVLRLAAMCALAFGGLRLISP